MMSSSLCKLIIIAIVLQVVSAQDPNAVTDNETTLTESEESTDAPKEAPRISTQSQTFLVEDGKSVVLPCHVDNMDASQPVMIWQRQKQGTNTEVLTVDAKRLASNRHISIDPKTFSQTYSLTIKRAHDHDSGNYTCTASGQEKASLTHQVIIVYPPSVDIQPNESPLDAVKDDPLRLSCVAKGFPEPSIQWKLTTSSGETKELTQFVNASTIEVPSLSRADVGTYTCVANNGVGEPVNDSIIVHIRYKPEISDASSVFLSRIGGEAKLECSFSAYPIDGHEFRWYRLTTSGDQLAEGGEDAGREEIQSDARQTIHTVAEDSTLSSTLTIHNVEKEDFRKYICAAQNALGQSEHEIELSGLAYPVGLQSTDKRDGVRWTVKSMSPVKEYRIIYREINETHEGEARNLTILEDGKDVPSDSADVKIYEKTYVFENLLPARNYSVIIMAQNEYGWSREMPHRFSLDDVRKAQASGLSGRGAANGIFNSHLSLVATSVVAVIVSRIACWN